MKSTEEIKLEFMEILGNVKREGMEPLKQFLSNSDFFKAPGSHKFHDAFPGGLAYHSLMVYKLLKKKCELYKLSISEEAIIICGLLHDLCKIDYYVERIPENASPAQVKYLSDLMKLSKDDVEERKKLEALEKGYASDLITWYINGQKGERPVSKISYMVDDKFPFGHGEKSIVQILKFMKLSEEEMLAIRWHMGFSDPAVHYRYPSGNAYQESIHKFPLVVLLYTSDFEANAISEWRNK